MSTTLEARQSRVHHPPHRQHVPARPRRVSLPDRIALRLGIALVQWSRRPRVIMARGTLVHGHAAQHDRRMRERQWQRQALLTFPPR